ncbi:MAG: MBOAT family O-acyltransferase [Oscillospiraceae bacterium]|nr:MBOAT family O-acyltransferase [Oscillospiraceae bacterium]
MLFNSYSYLIFLPAAAFVYFALPARAKRLWLLLASLFFYACWRAEYLILILLAVTTSYLSSLAMAAAENRGLDAESLKKRKRACLVFSLVLNLSILFFFKYFNFTAEALAALLRREATLLEVALPVGISFYTFQALGYTIDVYRGDIAAERDFIKYAAFICFFPQLVAGPIERAKNLLPQFDKPKPFDSDRMRDGLVLIGWGFFQKLVIADRLAIFVDGAFEAAESASGGALALAALFFAIQIYCDFASYSTIARGSALIMGFDLMRNFAAPYLSLSLAEFWQRWHISLSSWFRDYVYIPLGGSRRGLMRSCLNVLIIFFLSGLWHGANYTFIVWGLLHGAGRALGMLTRAPRERLRARLGLDGFAPYKLLQWLFVFSFAALAFVFFRADSVAQALLVLRGIFSGGYAGGDLLAYGLDGADMAVAGISLALLTAVDLLRKRGADLAGRLVRLPLAARWAVYIGGIALIAVFGVYGPAYDSAPFIYFQF